MVVRSDFDNDGVRDTAVGQYGPRTNPRASIPIRTELVTFQIEGGTGANNGLSELQVFESLNVAARSSVHRFVGIQRGAFQDRCDRHLTDWASAGELNPSIELSQLVRPMGHCSGDRSLRHPTG